MLDRELKRNNLISADNDKSSLQQQKQINFRKAKVLGALHEDVFGLHANDKDLHRRRDIGERSHCKSAIVDLGCLTIAFATSKTKKNFSFIFIYHASYE